jgi:prevent-host-death family protein
MDKVSVRDLRNNSAKVLRRVARGETLIVTSDGTPVAELRPLPRRPLPIGVLLERWKHIPKVDARALRADIDAILDMSL